MGLSSCRPKWASVLSYAASGAAVVPLLKPRQQSYEVSISQNFQIIFRPSRCVRTRTRVAISSFKLSPAEQSSDPAEQSSAVRPSSIPPHATLIDPNGHQRPRLAGGGAAAGLQDPGRDAAGPGGGGLRGAPEPPGPAQRAQPGGLRGDPARHVPPGPPPRRARRGALRFGPALLRGHRARRAREPAGRAARPRRRPRRRRRGAPPRDPRHAGRAHRRRALPEARHRGGPRRLRRRRSRPRGGVRHPLLLQGRHVRAQGGGHGHRRRPRRAAAPAGDRRLRQRRRPRAHRTQDHRARGQGDGARQQGVRLQAGAGGRCCKDRQRNIREVGMGSDGDEGRSAEKQRYNGRAGAGACSHVERGDDEI